MNIELLTIIIPVLSGAVGGVVGWLTGKRSKDNVYLQEQLTSVNLLLENNKTIVGRYTESQEKVVSLSAENAQLKEVIRSMEAEIKRLTRKNDDNNRKIQAMQQRLDALFNSDEK